MIYYGYYHQRKLPLILSPAYVEVVAVPEVNDPRCRLR
jgi:hypothetical protein